MEKGQYRHGEKKLQKTVHVTPTAWENFDEIANKFMISRSELVEMIGQGRLKVVRTESVG